MYALPPLYCFDAVGWAKEKASFFHSILRWSVAVSTKRRQSSRIAALLQEDARPIFSWPISAFTA